MSNDSTGRGYLTPAADGPAYDEALEQLISQWISGVSGLAESSILPRWADLAPPTPANDTTWCSFGISAVPHRDIPAQVQISDDQAEQWSWEQLTVLCSFYGPQGAGTAATFYAGIFIEQNNTELNTAGLSLCGAGTLFNLPELINNTWVRRYDLTVTLSRKTTRIYNIKTLKSASAQFFGE